MREGRCDKGHKRVVLVRNYAQIQTMDTRLAIAIAVDPGASIPVVWIQYGTQNMERDSSQVFKSDVLDEVMTLGVQSPTA